MELNLKKARKLEAKIQNHLDTNPLPILANVRVMGSLEDAKNAIAKSNKEVREKITERLDLIEIRYDIRRQIEVQNEKNLINQLMNERVIIQKSIEELSKISGTFEEADLEDKLKVHVDALKNPESYESRTTLHFHVFTEKEIDAFEDHKAKMKKKLEDIEDEISQKNLSSKIEIDDEAIKLLQSKRLV